MSIRSLQPHRASMSPSSSLYTIPDLDKPVCGFLNRKTITEPSGKKSKDRQWQTLWCQIKERKFEFYRVSGINVKPHGEPPPRDIYPPPNRTQQKSGFADLDGSFIEIDYTSQQEKDLDKRRRHLFRLILANKVEYLFQAPSENQMMQWVTNAKRSTFNEEVEVEGDLHLVDARIKASRCSINKKSKHNTNSVRVIGRNVPDDDEVDGTPLSLMDLDPRLLLLKKRLQSKRDLLRQMKKMLCSFHGDTECLYRETDVSTSRRNSSWTAHHQSSDTDLLPRRIGSVNDSNINDGSSVRTVTTLLSDYYLLPGVEWSLLKKGDHVEVLGRLPNGWCQCRAMRDATYEMDVLPSTIEDVTVTKGSDSKDEKEIDNEKDFISSEMIMSPDPVSPTPRRNVYDKELQESHDGLGESTESSTTSDLDITSPTRLRTESYLLATTDDSLIKTRQYSYMRKNSYKEATSHGLLDSISRDIQRTRHLSLVETQVPSAYELNSSCDEIKKLRIKILINMERENSKYDFPLVGAIPPSILHHFAKEAGRPTSLTSDYGSSAPAAEENLNTKRPNLDDIPVGVSMSTSMETSFETVSASSSFDVQSNMEIPKRDSEESQEDDTFVNGSFIVGSIPSKILINEPPPENPRQGRASSLPPLESVEELNMLSPCEDARLSISEASSPVPSELLEDEEDEEDDEEEEAEEREDEDGDSERPEKPTSFNSIPRKRRSIHVIPSPSSTLERKVGFDPNFIKDDKGKSKQKNKRSRSEDLTKQKKNIFHRFRSNLLGRKKGTKSEYETNGQSDLLDSLDDLGNMRTRVTSISGKALRTRGMEVTFGDSSSESESEESNDRRNDTPSHKSKSVQLTPVADRKQMDEQQRSSTPDPKIHEPLSKSVSTPVDVIKLEDRLKALTGGGPDLKKKVESRSLSQNFYEGSKITKYIQAPPKRVQRTIYLDPTVTRYGFHLECYELHVDQVKVLRAIVKDVQPGSPAFVAGLYPGDQILRVNQQDVSRYHVSQVVDAIQNADTDQSIELVVAFVEGVTRLQLQAKGEDYRVQLCEKQNRLGNLVKTEREQFRRCSSASLSPPPTPLSPSALDLTPWSKEVLSDDENDLHVFPYNRYLNNRVATTFDDVTQISCDILVIPLRSENKSVGGSEVRRVLQAAGNGLMDELCLAKHCTLGENILTQGYNLPAQVVCHAVFGMSDENIVSCCRSALDMAYKQNYESIVFWIEGFVSACVSPYLIIGTVREWLEESDNRLVFTQIVFAIPSSPAIFNLIERYFPLKDYERQKAIESLRYCTDDEDDEEEEENEGNSAQKIDVIIEQDKTTNMSVDSSLTSSTIHQDDTYVSTDSSLPSDSVNQKDVTTLPVIASEPATVKLAPSETNVPIPHEAPVRRDTITTNLNELDAILSDLNNEIASLSFQ